MLLFRLPCLLPEARLLLQNKEMPGELEKASV
jgi:hypothetical protein